MSKAQLQRGVQHTLATVAELDRHVAALREDAQGVGNAFIALQLVDIGNHVLALRGLVTTLQVRVGKPTTPGHDISDLPTTKL